MAARMRAEQAKYEGLFTERLKTRRHTHAHPLVVAALQEGSCGVCGTDDPGVTKVVRERLDGGHCPFCGSALPDADNGGDAGLLEDLRETGEKIVALEKELESQQAAVARWRGEADAAETHLREIRAELDGYRTANALALARRSVKGQEVQSASDGLQRQIDQLLGRKEQERERREGAKGELSELQTELLSAYAQVEGEFVPRFQDLAKLFLGIDLEIDLERRASTLKLRLSLANTDRRSPDELSESQRFFIDIALRMALAERLGSPEHPSFLYIDTPEGSLDIAYEYRAGEMFARFVMGEGRLLMTANINTSELLLRLADKCGAEQMSLVRMTDWTYLTEVQQESEDLFERAYGAIEQKLGVG
jgi:predicted  nucleic acid-binding Zn-ribbon protein